MKRAQEHTFNLTKPSTKLLLCFHLILLQITVSANTSFQLKQLFFYLFDLDVPNLEALQGKQIGDV